MKLKIRISRSGTQRKKIQRNVIGLYVQNWEPKNYQLSRFF